jgi:hypothetical protein
LLEIHLQQLWSDRRLPFHAFHLINGTPIEIFQPGTWNKSGSGPDFQFAKIRFEDLMWFGSIEFHIKSSDWYKHQHHTDLAYDNVILHVVYEYDEPVYLHQRLLPTLELKSYLSGVFEFPTKYRWKIDAKIHCSHRISDFLIEFKQMQQRAVQERIKRKYSLDYNSDQNAFDAYSVISKAFGAKSNSLSFELLTHQIPLHFHFNYNENEISALVLTNTQGWKGRNLQLTKNLYTRIISWTRFIRWYYKQQGLNDSVFNWSDGFIHANIKSKMLQNNLLINAKTYLDLHAYRLHRKQQSGMLPSMKYLQSLPAESNRINSIWKSIGITSKNALESQANLEIYQQFCAAKKCLNCCVGQQITKS